MTDDCCDMQRVRDGELMLMDAGCELHGYCSDVTRTWPVSGTYSKHQRAIYEIVLDAQRCLLPAKPPAPCARPTPAPGPSPTVLLSMPPMTGRHHLLGLQDSAVSCALQSLQIWGTGTCQNVGSAMHGCVQMMC